MSKKEAWGVLRPDKKGIWHLVNDDTHEPSGISSVSQTDEYVGRPFRRVGCSSLAGAVGAACPEQCDGVAAACEVWLAIGAPFGSQRVSPTRKVVTRAARFIEDRTHSFVGERDAWCTGLSGGAKVDSRNRRGRPFRLSPRAAM